jgi:hypothetical protein
MEDLIKFISESMLSGTVGNATFEALKNLFGDKFDRLFKYLKNNENEKFREELEKIIEENKKLKNELLSFQQNENRINQTHYGNGDIIGRDKVIINKTIYHEKTKDERNLLLFKIGWNAFSYINLPNDKKLGNIVKNNLFTMVTDLGIINKNELEYFNNTELVDTIGNRIKLRLGEKAFAAFMIGILSPSSIEHYDNQNFKKDILYFCEEIGKIHMCEEIFRIAQGYHDIDKIFNFIIETFSQNS